MNNKPLTLTKICKKCNSEKTMDNFRSQSSMKDGKKNWCKSCDDLYNKNRYLSKKDKYISKVLHWQKNNPQKVKEYKVKFLLNKKLIKQPKDNSNQSILDNKEPVVIPINDNVQIC